MGAVEGPYGNQVGPRRHPEARKERRWKESNFKGVLEPYRIRQMMDFGNQNGTKWDENRNENRSYVENGVWR